MRLSWMSCNFYIYFQFGLESCQHHHDGRIPLQWQWKMQLHVLLKLYTILLQELIDGFFHILQKLLSEKNRFKLPLTDESTLSGTSCNVPLYLHHSFQDVKTICNICTSYLLRMLVRLKNFHQGNNKNVSTCTACLGELTKF